MTAYPTSFANSPVYPAPVWSWAVGSWKPVGSRVGGPSRQLQSISGRSLKVVLNDVSTATFIISGDHQDALEVTDLVSDIWVSRNGVSLFRGRVTNTVDDIQETQYPLSVTASSYEHLLDRSLLLVGNTGDQAGPNGDWVFTNVEQSTIIWNLITYAQAKANGNLGITQGTWPTTGQLRSVTATGGSSVWSTIKALTAMDGGVDFSLDNNLVASLNYPSAGTDKGAILSWGGNVSRVRGTTDDSQYLNVIYQSGGSPAGGTTPAPLSLAESDIGGRPEGRWETAISSPELTTTNAISQAEAYYLHRYGDVLQTSWAVTMTPGSWGGPSTLWVGDVVRLSIARGRRQVDVSLRCYELDITLDQTGNETVTCTLGVTHPNDRSAIRYLARKLGNLARQ